MPETSRHVSRAPRLRCALYCWRQLSGSGAAAWSASLHRSGSCLPALGAAASRGIRALPLQSHVLSIFDCRRGEVRPEKRHRSYRPPPLALPQQRSVEYRRPGPIGLHTVKLATCRLLTRFASPRFLLLRCAAKGCSGYDHLLPRLRRLHAGHCGLLPGLRPRHGAG
jgi:hypothetical protein